MSKKEKIKLTVVGILLLLAMITNPILVLLVLGLTIPFAYYHFIKQE